MPIQVTWGNTEKTYTCFKFTGNWTWTEYYQSIKEGSALIQDVPYTVNILIDFSEAKVLPSSILSNIDSSMRQPPRHFDLGVIVSTSPFLSVITNMIDRLYGKNGTHFKIFRTREEADRFLMEYDKAKTH